MPKGVYLHKPRGPQSEEHRRKLSEVNKAHPCWSPNIKENIRIGQEAERKALEFLRPQYSYIEKSRSVCDFVAVQSGQIVFIEVKSRQSRLTRAQRAAQRFFGERYKVIRV